MKRLALAFWLAAATTAAAAPSVNVTGMVQHAGRVDLAPLKPVTVAASFHTMAGEQSHTWSGPLLLDVLNSAVIVDAPGKKTFFRHVVLASGSDGFTVAVAIGEIDPRLENKQVIIATQQDGKALAAPRLIVPRDAAFGRGVHELTVLDVR